MFYKYITKSAFTKHGIQSLQFNSNYADFLDPEIKFFANNPFYEVSHITLQNAIFKVLKISSTLLLLKAFLEHLNSNLRIFNSQYYPTCSPLSFWSYIVPLCAWYFLFLAYFQEVITYTVFITIVSEIYSTVL